MCLYMIWYLKEWVLTALNKSHYTTYIGVETFEYVRNSRTKHANFAK